MVVATGKKLKTQRSTKKAALGSLGESTVQFLNVKKIERKTEFMNLLTNVVHNYTKQHSVLVQAKTNANTVEYKLRTKRVAIALAKKAQSAFKQYHPHVTITTPNDGSYCHIIVEFN